MPAFSAPIDCTPWVIGGLWPAELSTVTDENASVAAHLRDDLRRIVSRTNDELKIIKRAGLDDAAWHAAEVRAIDEARSHAIRRVESALRHLHTMKVSPRPEPPQYPRRQVAARFTRSDDKTRVIPAVRSAPPPVVEERVEDKRAEDKTEVIPAVPAVEPAPEEFAETEIEPVIDAPDDTGAAADEESYGGRHRVPGDEDDDAAAETAAMPELEAATADEAPEPEPETTRLSVPVDEAEPVEADEDAVGRHRVSGDDDDVEETAILQAVQDPAEVAEPEAEPEPETARMAVAFDEAPAAEVAEPAAPEAEPRIEEPGPEPEAAGPEPEAPEPAAAEPDIHVAEPEAPVDTESDSERLQRLLAFVVRQEPQLNWAVGDRADGSTVLVTDLAHGWVPSGIELPEGVRLVEPGRRTGKISALLGETTRAVTYTPGDRVGRATDFGPTDASVQGRELPAVDDLGWELGRVTHWRDGLPRLVHTLAKAAAAGTGVVEEEADLLRVHLDTARYQVMAQYPEVEPALLLNCLLLAATESSVAGDRVSANYHFAWFQKLDEPPASQWTAES